jgi:hypothetical protein
LTPSVAPAHGTAHLVLGLLTDPDGAAGRLLLAGARTAEAVRAAATGDDAIDAEHLLLALLEGEDGAGLLTGLGVTADGVERALAAGSEG